MDASLSDILRGMEPLLPYNAECVGSSVSQYYDLQKSLKIGFLKKLRIFH